jgi:hypothetical protein
MTTTTVPAEITQFAERVRAELADLSAEDLDDLTDGLEADLAESLEEDPARTLPDPIAYAVELRTAAGLPPAPEQKPGRGLRGAVRSTASGLRTTGAQVAESLRAHPVTAGMLGFAVALQPLWWVMRAWVVYEICGSISGGSLEALPHNWAEFLLLAVLVVVSVQWGRGEWRPWAWLTGLVIVGNIGAALLLLPLVAATSNRSGHDEATVMMASSPDQGLTLSGRPVSNIYAYGPDGKLLKNVQLFDQTGRPLVPYLNPDYPGCPDVSCDEGGGMVPQASRLETGETAKNVYPLKVRRMVYDERGDLVPDQAGAQARSVPSPPFVKVPKVAPVKP